MKLAISEKITDSLANSGVITTEDRELYQYGVQQGLLMILNLITTLVIGLIFGLVWQSLIFLLTYIPLRSYAGGYHARTPMKCYLFSIVIMSAALLGMKFIVWTNFICLTIGLFAAGIIFFLAPVEDSNKPLNEREIKVYKKRTRILLGSEAVIMCIFLMLQNLQLAGCFAMVFLVLSFMLILGELKNKHKN